MHEFYNTKLSYCKECNRAIVRECMRRKKERPERTCAKCGRVLPSSEFSGAISYCRECHRALRRKWYAAKKAKRVNPDIGKIVQRDGRWVVLYGRGRGKVYWTPDMISIVRKYYHTNSNKEIGEMIGVSKTLVHRKARELGMKKNPDYLTAVRKQTGLMAGIALKRKYRLLREQKNNGERKEV